MIECEMEASHTPGTGVIGQNFVFCHVLPLRLQEVGSGQDMFFLIGIFECLKHHWRDAAFAIEDFILL